MYITREISKIIKKDLKSNKAIVIAGPRQVGKTTLIKKMMSESDSNKTLLLNCDEADVRLLLENTSSTELKNIIGNKTFVFVDEAQRVSNIGLSLKLLIDNMPDVKLFVTGSSALELRNKVNEPLTGRKFEYKLYPLSTSELITHTSLLEEKRMLEQRLIYGFYPDVINNPSDSKKILSEILNSYLFKDILSYQDVRNPDVLYRLLTALSLQVGSEVVYSEIATMLGISSETVERYIDLMEKSFIIFRLYSFSRNLRNELKKSRKIYFYDNGIRNAVINNFNILEMRDDVGKLWENFLVSERQKHNQYNEIFSNKYFWRTHSQQEIDYIEEKDGILYAFEFKYNPNKKAKLPSSFSQAYPNNAYFCVNRDNYLEFIH